MGLEFWNSFFKIAGILAAFATAAFGAAALYTETLVNKRQSERLVVIGKDVADAQAKQAVAETRLKTVEGETAKQQERAAEAERTLEKERTARIELDRRTANRWLEPKDMDRLSADLTRFSGQAAEVVVFPVNFESTGIADLIHGILLNAKWNPGISAQRLREPAQMPVPSGAITPILVQGIYIRASGDDASKAAGRALFDALSKTVAGGIYNPSPLPGEPRVFVLVGDKPTPLSVWVRE